MSKIAVVGSKGVVGRTLVEYFTTLDHQVFSVDKDTESKLENVVPLSDVVFIVTLPIEEVASLIEKVAFFMKPGTLLIHGTSIEGLASLKIGEVLSRGITLSHLHFHFRPEVPLSKTLFGQHITISMQGEKQTEWQEWITQQFEPARPIIHWLAPGQHDETTALSQLFHMLTTVIISGVWGNFQDPAVEKAVTIGGPPCKLLVRSILRVGTGAKVAESILYNHSSTLSVVGLIEGVLEKLRSDLLAKESGVLEKQLSFARTKIVPAQLEYLDKSTAKLARLEADIQKANFEFTFSVEQNVLGLLARVLNEFDKRGIQKTTTIAQLNPDGGCTIIIGVNEADENALATEKLIRGWINS